MNGLVAVMIVPLCAGEMIMNCTILKKKAKNRKARFLNMT
jgi:hypothetical protein